MEGVLDRGDAAPLEEDVAADRAPRDQRRRVERPQGGPHRERIMTGRRVKLTQAQLEMLALAEVHGPVDIYDRHRRRRPTSSPADASSVASRSPGRGS